MRMRKFPATVFATLALLLIGLGEFGAAFPSAHAAGPLARLYRGARPQAMGGAFFAIADDENAIFMNPAGMAGIRHYKFSYLPVDITGSMDVYTTYSEGMDAFSSGISSETFNALAGKDLFAQVQIAPTIVIPNLGIGAVVDGQFAAGAKNSPYPILQMTYQTTNAIQAAWGTSIYRDRRGRSDLRVGAAAKLVSRRGGFREVPLPDALELQNGISSVAGQWGLGYGFDLGTQYVTRLTKQVTFSTAAVFLDVGDTDFTNHADSIPGNFGVGFAGKYDLGFSQVTLAYDYSHITQDIDWRKRTHLGMEFKIPMLSLYGGLDGVGLTYGVAFDAWIFRVTALSYREELGEFVGQWPSRRFTARIDLKFGL